MTQTRTRKTPSTKVTPKVEELRPVPSQTRPETLLKVSDYVSDIKVRWEIHQYVIKALSDDIKAGYSVIKPKAVEMFNTVKPYVVNSYQYLVGQYQRLTSAQ